MKSRFTSRSAASEARALAGPAQPEAQRKVQAAPATVPDTRTVSLAQLQLQRMAGASSQAVQLKARAAVMAGHGDAPVQCVEDEELLQGKFAPVQRIAQPNGTGLPDQLKSGVESLSGMTMDHVKVHYNSDKPSQLQAHAYAQGSEIHVAPGQEQHLPHEAWHVVQQAQGRVKPTMQLKAGVPVNDDVGLEAEADTMGAKALSLGADVQREAL